MNHCVVEMLKPDLELDLNELNYKVYPVVGLCLKSRVSCVETTARQVMLSTPCQR